MSRRGRQRRHKGAEETKTRVPIIPMLDMAFQLLAFGLSTFELSNIYEEGQFSMALPQAGDSAPAPASTTLDQDVEDFTLQVLADGNGGIDSISYSTTKEKDAKPLPKQREPLAAELAKLRQEKAGPNKEPKLDAQFQGDLNYQLVFEVLSAAEVAKFKNVTPMLWTEKKEPK
jgi:biopolymer transport protein ExbD